MSRSTHARRGVSGPPPVALGLLLVILVWLTTHRVSSATTLSFTLEEPAELVVRRKVCGLVVHFNPLRLRSRLDAYRRARAESARQGLSAVVVELVLGDEDTAFDIDEPDAAAAVNETRLVRRRAIPDEAFLWQKEALLNVALDHLPEEWTWCEKLVWLDSDVVFEDEWLSFVESSDGFPVQPFRSMVLLREAETSPSSYWRRAGVSPRLVQLGRREGMFWHSVSAEEGGYEGFAWAANRSLVQRARFYDRAVLGGGDVLMLPALRGLDEAWCLARLTETAHAHYESWLVKAQAIYAPRPPLNASEAPLAAHLWHGNRKDRGYQHRQQILLRHGFDPDAMVAPDALGVLRWTSAAPEALRREVVEYFKGRKEEYTGLRRKRVEEAEGVFVK